MRYGNCVPPNGGITRIEEMVVAYFRTQELLATYPEVLCSIPRFSEK
jgi:hypothetical protein